MKNQCQSEKTTSEVDKKIWPKKIWLIWLFITFFSLFLGLLCINQMFFYHGHDFMQILEIKLLGCGQLLASSTSDLPQWISPLQRFDWMALGKFILKDRNYSSVWRVKRLASNSAFRKLPITSWQIDGETVETVTDFIFLGSKITTDGNCSHEIKRCLPLEEKLWPT